MVHNQTTIKTKGLTVHELVDYIGQQYPDFKAALLQFSALPNPSVELSINWVPVRGSAGLETSVKGGDYVKFRDQTEPFTSASVS